MNNEYLFARIYDPVVDPYIRKIRYKILDLARQLKPAQILDVCCGTGNQMKLLGKNGFNVTGIDLSREMIRVSGKGLDGVKCVKGNAAAMPFDDSSFDMVMTTLSLHENTLEIAEKIIGEMFRVNKPDGTLILIDYKINPDIPWYARFVTKTAERMVGGDHYRNFKIYQSKGGLQHLLRNFRFTVKQEYPFPGHGLTCLMLQKEA